MTYLITGAGPHNKGAELMLLATIQQVRQFDPDAVFVVDPRCGPYEWRARLGLRQLFDAHQSGWLSPVRTRLFHAEYRARFGLTTPEEIDVILDASGFAFGDQWKVQHVEGSATFFERYRDLGTRIVLLPQAFGPFALAPIRAACRRILQASSLVFARDPESLAYCSALGRTDAPLLLFPDFTGLIPGRLPLSWTADEKHVALVPNRQMVARAKASSRGYVALFAEAMRQVARAGYRPFVLAHEQNDHDLAAAIAGEAGMPDALVRYDDPLELKGILGACAFCVGSRFHAIVSALSQGVPCLGTGWSHKYRQLFSDYRASEWIDAWDTGPTHWLTKLQELAAPATQMMLRERLTVRAHELAEGSRQMWALVAQCSFQPR